MARVEYLNDPNAPKANSIVVAVTVFAQDDQGRVLLIHRTDNDLWALPGGAQDIGESIAQTAVRETHEESGINVEVTGLVGIYSNPAHVVAFSDGEVRQQFSICMRATPLGGSLRGSSETREARWVDMETISALNVNPSMRLRIDHGFAKLAEPYIG